jgi:hypothetical protein
MTAGITLRPGRLWRAEASRAARFIASAPLGLMPSLPPRLSNIPCSGTW